MASSAIMRRLACLGGIALVIACRRTPPPVPTADAGTIALVKAEPTSDKGPPSIVRMPEDAAPPPKAAPPLPLASDELELVAIGKRWASKLISLQALGERVWLSGVDVDAYADGDGPLTKGPDLLAKLPYDPKQHRVEVVGRAPKLVALRTKHVETRMDSPEPTLFVLRDGAWAPGKPLRHAYFPHAFVPWGDGAMLVYSQIQLNAGPYFTEGEPGTEVEVVAPDGAVSEPKLKLPPRLLAWSAASDGTTLSIIGTMGAPTTPTGELQKMPVVVVRGTQKDGFTTTTLFKNAYVNMETYFGRVAETGSATLAWLPSTTIPESWLPSSATMYAIAGGAATKRELGGGKDDMCGADKAVLADGVAYAIRRCVMIDGRALVRVAEGGPLTRVKMPMLARAEGGGFRVAKPGDKTAFACSPKHLVVRGASDLWVAAECGGEGSDQLPAVFRRGRPQEPVIIP